MARKILLAEDSLTIQKVFEITLAKSGTSLTVVDNGADAVRVAAEIAPDLVVADVSLPEKDGYQVASEVRTSAGRGCPVLVLSGSVTPFDEAKFKASGASGVLFKPFESQQLIDKIEEMLRGRESLPAAGAAVAGSAGPDDDAERRDGPEDAAKPEEKDEHPPGGSEPWDFSDVLEEVEAEVGTKPGPQPPPPSRGEDLLPGGTPVPLEAARGSLSLGEFDVSLDEADEGPAPAAPAVSDIPPPVEARELSAPPPEVAPPEGIDVPLATHLDGDLVGDAPSAVTVIEPPADEALIASDELEEIEEIERLDAAARPEAPPAAPAEPSAAPPPHAAAAGDEFSARAREIFERVASEAVEKAVWEFMERFARDYSDALRESVESVAWEVIPPTAEAIIREEVARIRAQAEKKPSEN